MNTVGERLRYVLKKRGLSQAALARRIGITPASMSQIVNGIHNLSQRSCRDICATLDINEAWLRSGEGEMENGSAKTYAEEFAKKYGLGEHAAAIIEIIAKAVTDLDEETSARVLDAVYAELDRRVKRKKPLLIPHDVAEAALADALAEEKSQAE